MGCYFIYNIFTLTANQEKAHAEVFYDHLKKENGGTVFIDNAGYPIDNYDKIEDLLKSAQHNEYEEYEKVYPEFAKIAKEEGFADVAFSFEKIAEIEKSTATASAALRSLSRAVRCSKGTRTPNGCASTAATFTRASLCLSSVPSVRSTKGILFRSSTTNLLPQNTALRKIKNPQKRLCFRPYCHALSIRAEFYIVNIRQ